jgi:hypothetical protein
MHKNIIAMIIGKSKEKIGAIIISIMILVFLVDFDRTIELAHLKTFDCRKSKTSIFHIKIPSNTLPERSLITILCSHVILVDPDEKFTIISPAFKVTDVTEGQSINIFTAITDPALQSNFSSLLIVCSHVYFFVIGFASMSEISVPTNLILN